MHAHLNEFTEISKHLFTTAELEESGVSRRQITRKGTTGELTSIRKGVFCETEYWQSLKRHMQYKAKILAYNKVANQPLFSHETAAIIQGLAVPFVPEKLHIYSSGRAHGKVRDVVRHNLLTEKTNFAFHLDNLKTTTLHDTLRDCAKTLPWREGVAVADSAVHRRGMSYVELKDHLEGTRGRNSRRARWVGASMSAKSESPGESMVRLLLEEMELRYEEQVWMQFDDDRRRVDFVLLDYPVVIEFDGMFKYTDFSSADLAILDERAREVSIQNTGWLMFRTNWRDVAVNPARFKDQLRKLLRGVERAHLKLEMG